MPTLAVSAETLKLINEQVTPGYGARSTATRRSDGLWDLVVDDEVAAHIEAARLPGETDEDAVSRLVRAATGQRPS